MLRQTLCVLIATAGITVHGTAAVAKPMSDSDATRFFNAKGCKSCHAANEMRVGPSYRMIAQRYPNAPAEALERLSLKVLRGGSGTWGTTPMISHPDVSEAEAETIVRWILNAPHGEERKK